jgi:hypothetical protein
MFAVTATQIDPDNPLAGLTLGERPEPKVPEGWTTVTVKAASLNHHDLFTLKGVGIRQDQLPMVLGGDAAGLDEDGNEVIVHSVIGSGADETLDPKRSLLSEKYDGTFAERVAVPRRNLVPKPAALSFGGGLPADRVVDRLPDVVREGRAGAGLDRAGPGCRWRRGHGADHAGQGGRLPGLGDQPLGGEASPGAGARRRSGF